MSHLMDTLLEDQRRMEADPAHIAPVVAQAEQAAQAGFVSMAGQDSRVARLMREAAENRARADRLAAALDVAQCRIAQLSADLLTIKGENATAQDGSHIARVILGDCYALVEYDHVAAEAPNYNVESPTCGPGREESITPLNVFLNGYWCDIDDVRAALEYEALVEAIAVVLA